MEEEQSGASVITMVEKQKKSKYRYNIYLDEAYAFSVHEDIMLKHRLIKGESIEGKRIREIVRDDETHQAYLEAIRYIGRRPRSLKEVKLHLKQKEYDPDIISDIAGRLQEQKYIDDSEFAKLWTEHRIFSQKKGRRWVEMELSQKGLSNDEIANALLQIDKEDEFAAAYDIGAKKWRITNGELFERKRKVMAFLLRRGYTEEMVRKAVNRLSEQGIGED